MPPKPSAETAIALLCDAAEPERPTAVITVRMLPSMHRRISEAAWANKTSINQFCISAIESRLPPPE